MENQEFPKGVGFAPFLRSFMSNSSISSNPQLSSSASFLRLNVLSSLN